MTFQLHTGRQRQPARCWVRLLGTRRSRTGEVRDSRLLRSLVVWSVLLLLAWLDRDCAVVAQQASVFAAIVQAIVWLGDLLATIGTAIATTAEAAVIYLAQALGWLAKHVADILVSTGRMFAKVWHWVKLAWTDVVKPFLVWVDDIFTRFVKWMNKFFKPVFDFLTRVRDVLKDVYQRFIRPILDALNIAHVVLKTLGDLGVAWAKKLDRYVLETQQIITENFLRVLGWLNEVRDIVNAIVTPDRLLQRVPFLRTIERDAGWWIRGFWNSQVRAGARPTPGLRGAKKLVLTDPKDYGRELGAFYRDGGGAYADYIRELVPEWRKAAGFEPDNRV